MIWMSLIMSSNVFDLNCHKAKQVPSPRGFENFDLLHSEMHPIPGQLPPFPADLARGQITAVIKDSRPEAIDVSEKCGAHEAPE
jgi:hypothetical protein